MKVARLRFGEPPPRSVEGAVLTRDVNVGPERWRKGRRLSSVDLAAVAAVDAREARGDIVVLLPDIGDVHEDDAAARLARAVAGPGVAVGPPIQSRIDLRAIAAGVLRVRPALLDRLNRIDPIEVFTAFDRSVVDPGTVVASVKVAPHLVPASVVEAAERAAAAAGRQGVVSVAPFRRRRIAAVVKQSVAGADRERFEASILAKIEGLGSRLVGIDYVADAVVPVTAALRARATGRGAARADLVLTAGSASTDPEDAFFLAIDALGGAIVRHGVPAHPGSMLWLGRIGRVPVVGLPTCGAYSKATAVDLLLPRLLSGEPASARTVAGLGHGGILTRDQRFRFPAYARELEAPDG